VIKQAAFHSASGDYVAAESREASARYGLISRKTPSSFWNSTGLVR
jgi:hypothetical protein